MIAYCVSSDDLGRSYEVLEENIGPEENLKRTTDSACSILFFAPLSPVIGVLFLRSGLPGAGAGEADRSHGNGICQGGAYERSV